MKSGGQLRSDPDKARAWQQRSKGMKRGRGPKPASDKTVAARPEHDIIREAVFRRDRGCRLSGVPDAGRCSGPPTPHHVLKASQGGEYTMENLVELCAAHNTRLESDAALAKVGEARGIVVRRGQLLELRAWMDAVAGVSGIPDAETAGQSERPPISASVLSTPLSSEVSQ